MEYEKDEIKVSRTEELKDIIDRMPLKTGRIITAIVAVLAGLLLFFGWLIEYPEKVTGPVSITARQAPVKLVANNSGKLHLLKSISDTLGENEIFAFIDNPAKLDDILLIGRYFDTKNPDSLYRDPVIPNYLSSLSLGELSIQYYNFLNAKEKVLQYHSGKPFDKKLKNLTSLLRSQLELLENNQKQLLTKTNTLRIAEKSVHRDSSLYLSSAIAEMDIDRSSASYFGVVESTGAMEKENTSIRIQIEDTRYKLEMLILEQKEAEAKLKMDLIASYNELVTGIRKWKLTYTFSSPFKGTLEYLNFWRENDFIAAGTEVFSILPADNPILGQVYLPSQGAGKVSAGQDVIIKLDNYPYIEYGSISGKVRTISGVANKTEIGGQNVINTYLILIDLPDLLTTNYGVTLDFSYEIKGIADILTKRRKLLERLFDNLKYIASKNKILFLDLNFRIMKKLQKLKLHDFEEIGIDGQKSMKGGDWVTVDGKQYWFVGEIEVFPSDQQLIVPDVK